MHLPGAFLSPNSKNKEKISDILPRKRFSYISGNRTF